jgi:hypothetical protein
MVTWTDSTVWSQRYSLPVMWDWQHGVPEMWSWQYSVPGTRPGQCLVLQVSVWRISARLADV